MGHGDQLAHALPHRLAAQGGDTVLGDHVVHERPRHRHHRALGQGGDDARATLPLHQVAGGQHDDRAAAGGILGGDHEGRLPAHARPDAGADGLRGHLARQVHHQGVVDADQVLVADQHAHVVHITELVELEDGVAVHDGQLLRGQGDAGAAHHLPPVQRLVFARHHPRLHQAGDAAGDDLRLDAQVVLVAQIHAQGGRDGADADLHRVPVLDDLAGHQGADDLGDGHLLLGAGRDGRRRWRLSLHEGVYARDVDVVLAAGADEALVHLGDDLFGLAAPGGGEPYAGAEAAVAVLVGGRDRHQVEVGLGDGPRRNLGLLPDADGQVVHQPLVDGVPVEGGGVVVDDVEGLQVGLLPHPGKEPRRVDDGHVLQLLPPLVEGLTEGEGGGGEGVDHDPVAGADGLHRLLGGGELIGDHLAPAHVVPPRCVPVCRLCRRSGRHVSIGPSAWRHVEHLHRGRVAHPLAEGAPLGLSGEPHHHIPALQGGVYVLADQFLVPAEDAQAGAEGGQGRVAGGGAGVHPQAAGHGAAGAVAFAGGVEYAHRFDDPHRGGGGGAAGRGGRRRGRRPGRGRRARRLGGRWRGRGKEGGDGRRGGGAGGGQRAHQGRRSRRLLRLPRQRPAQPGQRCHRRQHQQLAGGRQVPPPAQGPPPASPVSGLPRSRDGQPGRPQYNLPGRRLEEARQEVDDGGVEGGGRLQVDRVAGGQRHHLQEGHVRLGVATVLLEALLPLAHHQQGGDAVLADAPPHR